MTFEQRFAHWSVAYRWWIIALTLLTIAISTAGLGRLTFNSDTRVFFSKKNPQLQALDRLENTYTKSDTVIFLVLPGDGDVFTPDTLAAIEELTMAAWQVPHSSRVDSITNFQHSRAEEDALVVADLVHGARQLSDTELKEARRRALAEPLLVNRLVSAQGDITSVVINIILPGHSPDEVTQITDFARGLLHEFRAKYVDIDFYLTGTVPFDRAFVEVSNEDLRTLVPIMFTILIAVIWLALRSIAATLATVIVTLISTGTAMGLAGWWGLQLNPATAVAPTIILTLAVADSIHILVTMCRHFCAGEDKRSAIEESLSVNLKPVFLTSLTTVIGFLSMNLSDAPPFRELGNVVAVGVTAAFFYSVLFLPALIAVLPVRIKLRAVVEGKAFLERLAEFVIAHQRLLLGSTLFIAGLVTVGILRIELDDDYIKYFDQRYDIRVATDLMQERLTGTDLLEYSLSAGEPNGINDPAYLARVEEFANWYRSQAKVVHVRAITDTLKRLNQNMHGDDAAWYRIPQRRELAAQYLLLYEMSLPYGLDLNDQTNVDKSASRMTVTLQGTTAKQQRAIDQRAHQWLVDNTPTSMHSVGTGLSLMWAHISGRNIENMLMASFGALVLISLILIFALHSVRIGLISLAPNLAPAVMAFGLWGLLVGQVGLGLSVVVSMTLGIVVDDTVHFISKYQHGRKDHGLGPEDAVRYAFSTVGTAMWVTTAALGAGFLVLLLSGYKMSADMGLMSAITIMIALILDFLLLPPLLMKLRA
ncbi:MAG: MMPL family transporter [Gammaproteobacteria bacterium]|nr:MMPL family transporter [Gammaproteobacteria bacterium]